MTHTPTGRLIWLTGLSAAGKTTIAHALCERLCEMGIAVMWLDGDRIRREENCDLGYSREDRDENVRRIGAAALRSIREGYTVVVSAMSPFRQTRDEIRRTVPGFVEVYVSAPLDVCEARDKKNLYRRGRLGEITNVPGLDLPYEPPLRPEIECQSHMQSIDACVGQILAYLSGHMCFAAHQTPKSIFSNADSLRTSSR